MNNSNDVSLIRINSYLRKKLSTNNRYGNNDYFIFVRDARNTFDSACGVIAFGGAKIPELMRGIGKGVSEFKKGVRDVENEIKNTDTKEEDKKA